MRLHIEKIITVSLAICALSLAMLLVCDSVFLNAKILQRVQRVITGEGVSVQATPTTSVSQSSNKQLTRWTGGTASVSTVSSSATISSVASIAASSSIAPRITHAEIVKLPVIMYHHIKNWVGAEAFGDPKTERGLRVGPVVFERHLKYIEQQGYTTITAKELDAYYMGTGILPKKPILLTFDDGYVDNYENAFPLLKKYNMKGDFAIITGAVSTNAAYVTWDQLKEMLAAGMGISSHTVSHCQFAIKNPNVTQKSIKPFADSPVDETYRSCTSFVSPEQLNSGQVRFELAESKKVLEEKLSIEVPAIVYPYGNYNAQVIQIAKDIGYRQGYTILSEKNEEINLAEPFELTRYRGFGQDDNTSTQLLGFFNGGR